ncbi:MAG: glycosyltransferase family 39 protein [Paludisphaera borealis]|uniref:ArnT family glycosyltransferase n=1 Tax=Paludisphaera borealis TaxID=1387353 RepID=UPI002849D8C2|nr:glycosyltransferase family 39 protein [Paludisphaera borealis]MDR3622357.1 glycosyltransferase family 39 protein [Paludisphaera borealis]
MTPKRALALLIVVSTMIRLAAAAFLGLGNDEAYHFLYALHPAPSYYDHPPMVAWVEMLGLFGMGDVSSKLALRLGFVLLFAGSTWLMARIAGRWFGAWAGFYAALALNLTGYYGLAASTFALPDGPLLFFWLLTIDRLSLAIDEPRRLGLWACVGLAWGGAMLSKYHAVFLPAGTVLFLLLRPTQRRRLIEPGPYLAIAIGLAIFSPVIVWNASNGWASFAFQGKRAVVGPAFRLDYLLGALGAQAAYFFPWIWLPLIAIGWRLARRWNELETEHERLALCLCALPLGVFTAVACFRPVLPHWGLVGLVSLFPILGRDLADQSLALPSRTRRKLSVAACFSLVLLAVAVSEYRFGWLQRGEAGGFGVLTRRTDPTIDSYGWDQIADRLDRLGILDDPRAFIFTRNWYMSAQIAHATAMKRPVVCYNLDDPRGFAFWSEPEQWVGRDGVLVMINDDYTPLSFYDQWFESCKPLDDFWVERSGKPVRRVRILRFTNQLAALPYQFTPSQAAERAALRSQPSEPAPAPRAAIDSGPRDRVAR